MGESILVQVLGHSLERRQRGVRQMGAAENGAAKKPGGRDSRCHTLLVGSGTRRSESANGGSERISSDPAAARIAAQRRKGRRRALFRRAWISPLWVPDRPLDKQDGFPAPPRA